MAEHNTAPSPQTSENTLFGKTIAGYQAWFHTSEDPDHGWVHWSNESAPERGTVHPELFPDFSEYPDHVMRRSRFEPYPDGTPVSFYEAHAPEVIETHFRWMKEYGIDGIAVQRFYANTSATPLPEPVHLTAIRNAAERYGRLFYIMYDTSGCGVFGAQAIQRMKDDFRYNIEERGILSSPCYAHADGKPVVCIWGLAGTEPGRYPSAADAADLVGWLKERGYFVIGGLPDNRWTEVTDDYAAVYAMLDMASPWTPGRFHPEILDNWILRHLEKDQRYCKEHHMYYQPVLFSGFAWSNFCVGGRADGIPRNAGSFLWEQAKHYARAGVDCAYFAMFDEYDEATALAKAAPDSFCIPGGEQYFQTLSADGSWLSPDFYLRLAGKVTSLLRGEIPASEEVPVPHSAGPVYWRNGFEKRPAYVMLAAGEAKDTVLRNVDVCDAHAAVLYQEGVQLETASVIQGQRGEVAYTGRFGFAFSGIAMTESATTVVYRLAKTEIAPRGDLELSYRLRPVNEGGRRVGVDLLLDDGSFLSASLPELLEPKADEHLPKAGLGSFLPVKIALKDSLAGRSIKAVLVTYCGVREERFAAYLDDIVLQEKA